MNKYATWARLNLEGKRAWGTIFPNGVVPVQSIATQHVRLEGIKDVESVFTVNWKELTQKQQQAILENLRANRRHERSDIEGNFEGWFASSRRYTSGCGTNRMELFT